MSNRIREQRSEKEQRRNGGISRVAMGFAVVVITLIVVYMLFVL